MRNFRNCTGLLKNMIDGIPSRMRNVWSYRVDLLEIDIGHAVHNIFKNTGLFQRGLSQLCTVTTVYLHSISLMLFSGV